jgi:DNA-binding transcriptional regulator YdaS (Cro superfamily)
MILTSVEAVIEAMGGPTKTAAQLGQRPNTVSNWKLRNKIPPEHFLAVSEALKASGAVPDPQIFGMKSSP